MGHRKTANVSGFILEPIASLGAVLEQKGYSITIVDAGLYESATDIIASELDKKPIFAGFTPVPFKLADHHVVG
jgi:hypothetical protein